MELRTVKSKAFTLLELLVVIAIIALLLAIVIPSLVRAKEQGRDIYCQNNLHQMYLAAIIYTENHNGSFPIAYYNQGIDSAKTHFCWDFTVGPNGEIFPGILWQGEATIEKIQQCPSFKGASNTASDPYTGYNYNTSYIGHGEREAVSEPDRWNQMRRPAYCALFGDGEYVIGDTSSANKFMRSPRPSDSDWTFSGRQAGTQGFRHNRETNVVFCDGAVDTRKDWYLEGLSSRQKAIVEKYNRNNPKSPVGFLSADNSAYNPQ
jgi:prepilin-type N-terminal cleavage/methylation domain-containing protein/prepilin-type processing-associated H-X9-DG protein